MGCAWGVSSSGASGVTDPSGSKSGSGQNKK